jgi:hypothetical protein
METLAVKDLRDVALQDEKIITAKLIYDEDITKFI